MMVPDMPTNFVSECSCIQRETRRVHAARRFFNRCTSSQMMRSGLYVSSSNADFARPSMSYEKRRIWLGTSHCSAAFALDEGCRQEKQGSLGREDVGDEEGDKGLSLPYPDGKEPPSYYANVVECQGLHRTQRLPPLVGSKELCQLLDQVRDIVRGHRTTRKGDYATELCRCPDFTHGTPKLYAHMLHVQPWG